MASIIAEKIGFIQMTEVEIVIKPEKAHQLAKVLVSVWGGADPIPPDVIIAIIQAGGYASLASQIANGKKQFVGGSLAPSGKIAFACHWSDTQRNQLWCRSRTKGSSMVVGQRK
jgi:hypothetical protein